MHPPPARKGTTNDRSWLSIPLIVWIILSLTVLAYSQTIGFAFIHFDDPLYVTDNPQTLAGLSWGSVRWAFTCFEDGSYLPLVWLSHAACVSLFGTHPGGHHVVNLVLHLANSFLVFLVFRRMTGEAGPSAVVMALFALHPAHVESVAWVSARKDVLSTLFWLLTTWAYLGHVQAPNWKRYLGLSVLFILGLLSKSMLVTLPLTLLLFDYWPLGRHRRPAGKTGILLLEKLPLLLLSLVAGTATLWTQGTLDATTSLRILPLVDRAANALLGLQAYLGMLLWPLRLSPFYSHQGPGLPVGRLLAAGFVVLAVTVFSALQLRKRPYLLVGWGWFLLTLLPVSGLVQVGSQAYADRYTYVPFFGLFIMLAWSLKELVDRARISKSAVMAVSAAVLGTAATLTALQTSRWKDTETLFTHAVGLDPENQVALGNLGTALAQKGKFREAIGVYSRLVELNPRYYRFHYILGNLHERLGQPQEAMARWLEADRLDPAQVMAAYRISHFLVGQEDFTAASPFLQRILSAAPAAISRDARVRQSVLQSCLADHGIILREQGRLTGAMAELRRAVALNPADAWSRLQLGLTLRESSRESEARLEIDAALHMEPRNDTFRYWIGRGLTKVGRFEEAAQIYRALMESEGSVQLGQKGMESMKERKERTPGGHMRSR